MVHGRYQYLFGSSWDPPLQHNFLLFFFNCFETVAEMKHFEVLTAVLMKIPILWGSGFVD
jgi:hypothetical protein